MVDIKLVSLPGDGIGTEVVNATIGVLREAGERWGARFIVEPVEAGAARYARTGVVYSEADFEICRAADVILLGALGLPDVVHRDGTEAGPDLQFRLRFDLDLYAGVRPIRRYAAAPGPLATPDPFNFTIIRENTEGLYASRGGGAIVGDKVCTDTLIITAAGSDRIIRFAFEYALANAPLSGPPTVTCVDKANVLRSYAFFRSRFDALAKVYFGRVATQPGLCRRVLRADGDAADLDPCRRGGEHVRRHRLRSRGRNRRRASVSRHPAISATVHAVFQPSHGSAPTIAGKDEANPIATILSGAMMLDWLSRKDHANVLSGMAADIRSAVDRSLDEPASRTRDLGGAAGTRACAGAVAANLRGPEPR